MLFGLNPNAMALQLLEKHSLPTPLNWCDNHTITTPESETTPAYNVLTSVKYKQPIAAPGHIHTAEKRRYPDDLALSDDDSISQPEIEKAETFESAISAYTSEVDVVSGVDDVVGSIYRQSFD